MNDANATVSSAIRVLDPRDPRICGAGCVRGLRSPAGFYIVDNSAERLIRACFSYLMRK